MGALSELLYAHYFVLMSETIEGLLNKFIKWKEAFERNGLKVNLRKTKVMVSGRIIKDGMFKSKTMWGLPLESKVLCLHCGKWIHGRFSVMKMEIAKF